MQKGMHISVVYESYSTSSSLVIYTQKNSKRFSNGISRQIHSGLSFKDAFHECQMSRSCTALDDICVSFKAIYIYAFSRCLDPDWDLTISLLHLNSTPKQIQI